MAVQARASRNEAERLLEQSRELKHAIAALAEARAAMPALFAGLKEPDACLVSVTDDLAAALDCCCHCGAHDPASRDPNLCYECSR